MKQICQHKNISDKIIASAQQSERQSILYFYHGIYTTEDSNNIPPASWPVLFLNQCKDKEGLGWPGIWFKNDWATQPK